MTMSVSAASTSTSAAAHDLSRVDRIRMYVDKNLFYLCAMSIFNGSLVGGAGCLTAGIKEKSTGFTVLGGVLLAIAALVVVVSTFRFCFKLFDIHISPTQKV